MSESTAWILDFGNSVRTAVGELELVHLDDQPKLFAVPKAPDYCRHTMIWQNTIIPVVDLVVGLQGQNITRETCYAAIIRYRPADNGPLVHAALLLAAMPVRMDVDDNLACPLPKQPQAWKALAASCFTLDDTSIPIMELADIFSRSAQTILGGGNIKK